MYIDLVNVNLCPPCEEPKEPTINLIEPIPNKYNTDCYPNLIINMCLTKFCKEPPKGCY